MRTTTFRDELREKGYLVYTNKGISMLPLLRPDRDLMVIEQKKEGQLKKYDAVLFVRENGQYVLHRILEVREHDYWIVGDNCVSGEAIQEEQIIGVLTAVVRDGKKISVEDKGYRLYVWIWCYFYPVRALILRGKWFLKGFLDGRKKKDSQSRR